MFLNVSNTKIVYIYLNCYIYQAIIFQYNYNMMIGELKFINIYFYVGIYGLK